LKANYFSGFSMNKQFTRLDRHDRFLLVLMAILIFGLALFLLINFKVLREERIRVAFDINTADISNAIEQRVTLYQYGVRGVRGSATVKGLDNLTKADFLKYAQTRQIDMEFPGARGFGIIYKVKPSQIEDFERAMSADSGLDKRIKYLGPNNDEHFVIRYIEPLERNEAAVGLDIASEKNRYQAARRASETGLASLTGPITIVQATEQSSSAFLLLLPVYLDGEPLNTVDERRAATRGWAYSVLTFQEIIKSIDASRKFVAFAIRDITNQENTEVFYRSTDWDEANGVLESVSTQDIFGRQWEITFRALPGLVSNYQPYSLLTVNALLVGGVLVLLSGLYLFLVAKNLVGHEQKQQLAIAGELIEASPVAQLLVDSDGRIARVNRRAKELFGYEDKDLLGQKVEVLVPDESRSTHVKKRNTYSGDLLEIGGDGKALGQRSDGTRFPIQLILKKIDVNGISYVLGGLSDITERLRVLDELKQSEQSWRGLANSLPQLVWTCNSKGHIDFLSSQWGHLSSLQGSLDEPALFELLMHPDDLQNFMTLCVDAVKTCTPLQTECRFRNRLGSYLWFDVQQVPVIDNNGRLIRWVGSGTNIESRKKAEMQILETNSHLESLVSDRTNELSKAKQGLDNILNAMPSMIGYWDRDLSCKFANQPLARLLDQINPIDDVSKAKDVYEEMFGVQSRPVMRALSGEVSRFERLLDLPGADSLYLDVHYIPDRAGAHINGFFVLMQDVSEIRKAQLNAELMSKQKSAFLAIMSHEIRTPLNGILGFAGLLVEKVLDVEIKQDLRILLQNAQTLTTILNDILDITKIESGQLKLETIPFSLKEQIDTCRVLHQIPAQEKKLEFNVSYEGFDGSTSIMGDPTRLRQVIHNLLSNAIKFTPVGQVGLHVILKSLGEKANLIIRVSDTGVGIPQEKQSKLFTPFYQGDESTFRKFGGTGLGLSVIKSIVQALGGEISFTSSAEKGSVFEVSLPVQFTSIDKKIVEDRSREVSPKNILIVDDMPLNLMVLNKILTHDGHIVKQASDGYSAVELAKQVRFDLIFLDISMPDIDGYETTKLIRVSAGPNAATPIVALSGHAFDDDIQRSLQSGMTAHLSKPLDIDKVRQKIRELTA
jgi:PAS domain S-box-containing protein